MAKDFSKAFYKSGVWRQCRKSYIKTRKAIDGGMCEECHERLGYIVHHKVALTPGNINDPSITLNHSLLEYVCKECHDNIDEGHGLNKSKPLLCGFDEHGQPIDKRDL